MRDVKKSLELSTKAKEIAESKVHAKKIDTTQTKVTARKYDNMARRRTGSWNVDLERNSPCRVVKSRSSNHEAPKDSRGRGESERRNDAADRGTTIGKATAWKKKLSPYRCAVGAIGLLVLYMVFVGSWSSSHTAEPCQVARETAASLKRLRLEGRARASDEFPSDWKPGLPKIIHHQWKDENIPEKYDAWHQKWIDLYPAPDYTHMLWTDESAREMIKEHYSWFLETYDDYDYPIKRADAARYFYLYHYGGLHTDLDYEPLSDAIFKHLPTDRVALVESPYKFSENTQNSMMSSPKGDPFWLNVFTELIQNREKSLLSATGPKLMDKALQSSTHPVHILPCENFHRIPLGESQLSPFVTDMVRELLGRIYPMKQCGMYEDDACHFAEHTITPLCTLQNLVGGIFYGRCER